MNSVILSSLRRPTGEELCPGAQTRRVGTEMRARRGDRTMYLLGEAKEGTLNVAPRAGSASHGGLGLEPEHGAYLQERSDLQSPPFEGGGGVG